jgi:hypothetical protein
MTSRIGPRTLGVLISLVKVVEKVAQTKVIREVSWNVWFSRRWTTLTSHLANQKRPEVLEFHVGFVIKQQYIHVAYGVSFDNGVGNTVNKLL